MMATCAACSNLIDLMVRYDRDVNEIVPVDDDMKVRLPLGRDDVEVLLVFFQTWQEKRCNCIFRDLRNIDRLNLVVRGLLVTTVHNLKYIHRELSEGRAVGGNVPDETKPSTTTSQESNESKEEDEEERNDEAEDDEEEDQVMNTSNDSNHEENPDEDRWSLDDRERLIVLASRVFSSQFPVYGLHRNSLHNNRLDELSQYEIAFLANYCDLSIDDHPIILLRNIAFFCEFNVLDILVGIFSKGKLETLPLSLAHAMAAMMHHLKAGLNVQTLLLKLVSLRSAVIQYLCKVPDEDLKVPATRSMFQNMYSAVKDPMDRGVLFKTTVVDKGLTLALKYFTSTTLTVRLLGIADINHYISMFIDYSQSDNNVTPTLQTLQEELIRWILSNQIVEHIFGPNLHVEVIKQSHIVLNFIVSHITCDHVDTIWAAAQLKHCSKQVYDLLTQLVKNMRLTCVLHLYSLLQGLDVKDHNEHTLHLALGILKYIWSRSLNVQGPLVNSLVSSSSLKTTPIFMILANRSNDGESSSASADGSDDEEEDDFDAVVTDDVSGRPLEQVHDEAPSPGDGSDSGWSRSSEEVAIPLGNKPIKTKVVVPGEQQTSDNFDSEDETVVADSTNSCPIKEGSGSRKIKTGHHSSQNSESSLKRMSDFEGEDSNDGEMMDEDDDDEDPDETDVALLPGIVESCSPVQLDKPITCLPLSREQQAGKEDSVFKQFTMDNVCVSGNTILWDLLQDDKIDSLPEGMAQECERLLYALIMWVNDRRLRMKFIEGCLENLEKNTSVIVSLKLLPKLFLSFQQPRGGRDIHPVTLWADSERLMLKHFFDNLSLYCQTRTESPSSLSPEPRTSRTSRQGRISHLEEIQTRLHFMTMLFNSTCSPDSLMLNLEQLDILWSCLAFDTICRDELFHWMINTIRSRDNHALSHDLYRHILIEKLPQIKAENFSMLALDILNHLCMIFMHEKSEAEEVIPVAIKLLWDIALTACSTEVSITATRHLNNYYIHASPDTEGSLSKENEFIAQCMKFLRDSASLLKTDEDKHSAVIQRAMILLKTHLEVFRTRYSFHLRKMQLEGDNVVISHKNKVGDRNGQNIIRIDCTTASRGMDKAGCRFEMQSTDYLGDLRAEITHWWERILKTYDDEEGMTSTCLRLLCKGHELYPEQDESRLSDLGFSDMQLVYVSVGNSKQPRKAPSLEGVEPACLQPRPPKHRIPFLLLLNKSYFEQLFDLAQQLGSMGGVSHIRFQLLSRRVWEIIQMLPTSPDLLNRLQSLNENSQSSQESMSLLLNDLLTPTNPQKLIYCVQIVEWLRRTYIRKEKSWAEDFVECGGLQHIFDIFVSGILQQNDDSQRSWNEWKQDCLATLLQLIYKFGLSSRDPRISDSAGSSCSKDSETQTPSRKKQRRKGTSEKLIVHQFHDRLLEMLKDVESVLRVLLTILDEACLRPSEKSSCQTGIFGRSQVVSHTIIFLTSWAFSDTSVGHAMLVCQNFPSILRKLLLDDPDPGVRREASTGFYRFCQGITCGVKKGTVFTPGMLKALLSFVSIAQSMRPCDPDSESNEDVIFSEKEPRGPGCKDYFWLVRILLESDVENKDTINFDHLCSTITSGIIVREVRESNVLCNEDEGLSGLISLMSAVLKHNPGFKSKSEGNKFLLNMYNSLFDLPSLTDKNPPKCKHSVTRSAAFDLLVELTKGCEANFVSMAKKLQGQHNNSCHAPYPWDFWPHDDCRSECGYVGLVNLGATCYMASCLQHLFMIPEARKAVLTAIISKDVKHEQILHELQRMFAFLQESERKSYSPRNFCKVYTMDHVPLNTGEQKDMTEFFTDLISKFEEMSEEMKTMVKKLFGGSLSNNVVSLDCPHISRTSEEFYSLRCKVSDMRSLFDSLDDLTVKDTLEGDNMYTCSQCGKKVRADKRACIKKLPRILCFNTMRYSFNMLTMTKEKVNTHFSFPLTLDMSPYLEKNLIPNQDNSKEETDDTIQEEEESCEYELIGVTVHTGTAEGGHYYSFIREREVSKDRDKWYMFNDAEVKFFDPSQLGAECFGGEMTSQTYNSVTGKLVDYPYVKTNSAYMLFYERIEKPCVSEPGPSVVVSTTTLPQELSSWIWEDNTQFMKGRSIFEHSYFEFMYQVCSYVPSTLPSPLSSDVSLLSTKLATSFLLETLIHSKEKPTLTNWIELLNKQFVTNQAAGEWLLDHMSEDPHWPLLILFKCPNQMIRQLFQRLCVHVVNQLRDRQKHLYLDPLPDCKKEGAQETDLEVLKHVGDFSCVTRFVKKLLTLLKVNTLHKPHPRHLTEYFNLLLEFAKIGDEESSFLLVVGAIKTVVQFYLNHCKGGTDFMDVTSDEDEDDDEDVNSTSFRGSHVTHLALDEKVLRPASLDKMIAFVAYLAEKSRGSGDGRRHLSPSVKEAVFSGKSFPFVQRLIRDNVNLKQTINLLISFCRFNDTAVTSIVNMLLTSINQLADSSNPFFRVLGMLIDYSQDLTGLPNFGEIIYPRILPEVADQAPQLSLEWLTVQVTRNSTAHSVVFNCMDVWVGRYLICHLNQRIRTAAAHLLVSLVPDVGFRQSFNKSPRFMPLHLREHHHLDLHSEAVGVIRKILDCLMKLLKTAREHADPNKYGTSKLVSYFLVMSHCLISKEEKGKLTQYFFDLWQVFQHRISEPAVPVNHNKQALLHFWYQACIDCPHNVNCIINSSQVTTDIAFNYILADHEDQEVIQFNKLMLPSYYGILRLCCQQSRQFARKLANHQNIQWAFKNITPYMSLYPQAANELFELMKLFVHVYPDTSEADLKDIRIFKRSTLLMYINSIDWRSNWQPFLTAIHILIQDTHDKAVLITNNGILVLFQIFCRLYHMFHEATACHVTNEIIDVLGILKDLLEAASETTIQEVKDWCQKWRSLEDFIQRLVYLLNTYTPANVRTASMKLLEQLIILYPKECVPLIETLAVGHVTFQEQIANFSAGPYFPRRGQKVLQTKSSLRPPKEVFQMHFHQKMLELRSGIDAEYDAAVIDFFSPYYTFVVNICRSAIKTNFVNQELVGLCSMVALESLPMKVEVFIDFWKELLDLDSDDDSSDHESEKEFLDLLCKNCTNFRDYITQILTQERAFLLQDNTYLFLKQMSPRIKASSMIPQVSSLTLSLTSDLTRVSQPPLDVLRCLNITLSLEDEPSVPHEVLLILKNLKKNPETTTTPTTSSATIITACSEDPPDVTPRKKMKVETGDEKEEECPTNTVICEPLTEEEMASTSSSSSSTSSSTFSSSPDNSICEDKIQACVLEMIDLLESDKNKTLEPTTP